jgi:predicted ATPase
MDAFLRSVTLLRDRVEDFGRYPFTIPAIRGLETLELHPKVTFLIGENGAGKSTLLEAIAICAGFNPEGGSTNFRFSTRPSESGLHAQLRLARGVRRPKTGFFLRAESFFNVASQIDALGMTGHYGGTSLHEQSHGESFMALVNHRFGDHGLYLLDEPEAALSPQRQLALLSAIHRLVEEGASQFLIATHSPIVLAYPQARIFSLSERGLEPIDYEETEHYRLTRDFLSDRQRYLRRLFASTGEAQKNGR